MRRIEGKQVALLSGFVTLVVMFEVHAPGGVAGAQLQTAETSLPLATLATKLEAYVRQSIEASSLSATERAAMTSTATTVASTPASLVTVRFYSSGVFHAAEFAYIFRHRGLIYILTYDANADRLSAEKPIFDSSVRSIRFTPNA